MVSKITSSALNFLKPMKNKIIFTLLIFFCASAFTLNYFKTGPQKKKQPAPASAFEPYWHTVDSLQKKGLNKSALEIVMKIYDKARLEKNTSQLIKAIIHRMKFESFTEEDDIKKSIADLKTDCEQASFPANAVLHSMLAETYRRFYEQNRWKFMNRTVTTGFKDEDINTWDLKKISEQIVLEYRRSLYARDLEMKTPVNIFDAVLEKDFTEEGRTLRPTLYDFLAHRALDFFMNEEYGLTQPVNKYRIDAAWYLNDVDLFLNFGLQKEDSLDTKYNAILLLQDLIRFHLDDAYPGALIDVNLKRLKFVHEQLSIAAKDSLYLAGLQHIADRYKEYPGSTDALYEIASLDVSLGSTYKPGDNDQIRMMKRKGELVCDTAISRFPYSHGGLNCKSLKAEILSKSLSFQTEQVNVPEKPFLGILNYGNIEKVFARVARMDKDAADEYELQGLSQEKLLKYYISLPVINEWSIGLPSDSDRQTHSAEFKVPPLPAGKYVILISANQNFSYTKNTVAFASLWISNISTVYRKMDNGSYDYYVLHRTTGAPMEGAAATVLFMKYDNTSHSYVTQKGKTFTSNADGYINIPPENENQNFGLRIDNGSDRLFLNDHFYSSPNEPQQKIQTITYFFTDRSIYRPGQTLYFKGIILETDGNKSWIKPKTTTTVNLFDANSQKISEQTFTTNEFGTFNGTFTTPQSVLTGMMRLQNESGMAYFSVEEYKRPKFEVTFEPLKGTFLLNDRITVTAKTFSYSGAPVTNAGVTYRVRRTMPVPWWYNRWRGYFPSSQATEITNGVSATDEGGLTKITFDAIPDYKIPKESNPVFSFTITADVTDINGETHSSSQELSISYNALFIETNLKNELNRETEKSFLIRSRNMAGIFEPAKGTVTINRLQEPDRLLRERLWTAGDRHTITADEFVKEFPNDIYETENEIENLKKGELVLSATFDTEKDSTIRLNDAVNWKQGKYIVEIHSKDKYDHDVKHVRYFTLYSAKEKTNALFSFVTFIPAKTSCEPGEEAQLIIGTSDKNVKMLYEVELKNKIVSAQWLALSNEQKLITIPVTEDHRGNFSVHFTCVIKNRLYQFDQLITVPWSNKDIDFSFETFRDKLLPGAKEEWKVKLSGKFAEKFTAEMLASMYDASLDAFAPHQWNMHIWNNYFSRYQFSRGSDFGSKGSQNIGIDWNEILESGNGIRKYDRLNWFGYSPGRRQYFMDGVAASSAQSLQTAPNKTFTYDEITEAPLKDVSGRIKSVTISPNSKDQKEKEENSIATQTPVNPRTNFSETAFFYPTLYTNDKNEVVFSFTMPEALTRWKFMAMAHTKLLEYGIVEKEIITQKELMVVPNAPRFLREGDSLTFPCKITNLSDSGMTGVATLSVFDALTNMNVTRQILKGDNVISFHADKAANTNVSWHLVIPDGFSAVKYRITAQSQKFSDGEEQVIPVLTNRMLVTESMPLWANSGQTKTFSFDKLKNNSSSTLRNHKLTLEYTSNPAWYAIQALPYLIEYPYECSEQIFSRYYGNALASYIANSSHEIKAVFDSWKTQSPESFLSNLEKNQELKSVLLQQTPWVLDAQNESERKKRVALLFDINRMSNESQSALLKLQQKQNPDGSWSWFDGMPGDRYITQYIVEGFGHLDHLGVKSIRENERSWSMVQHAVQYLDKMIYDDYMKSDPKNLRDEPLSSFQIHYLYARSFFKDLPVENLYRKALSHYLDLEKISWMNYNNEYLQSMMALTQFRNNDKEVASDIIKSLKENSQYSEELGRYWKNNTGGYYWALASIETQSILIEAFHDVTGDKQAVDEMRRWLLKNKQTNDWKTTKATAEACYALLLQGVDFLSSSTPAEITLGKEKINASKDPDTKAEAGTGYFKISWNYNDIKSEMADVKISNANEVPGWGALYWQYFEQLDKITPHETPLRIQKQLFIEQNSPSGKIMSPMNEQVSAKVGDRIKVRIELRVDRDMEYVMMKDMRASGLEPENVISASKWQDGLAYYESTHDASTDFFFAYLPKGTYVFEYPLRAFQEGNFSNGITNIQCMYAPEYAAHSEGTRLSVIR
jgi:uncharacterized protein YfaS (alpha-2-macroglobulin family)